MATTLGRSVRVDAEVRPEQLIPVLIAASMDEVAGVRPSNDAATGSRRLPRTRRLSASRGPNSRFAKVVIPSLRRSRRWRLGISATPDLAARANVVAGRAAHVASREEQAKAYFGRQRRLRSRRTSPESLIGRAPCRDRAGVQRLPRALRRLGSHQAIDPEEQVLTRRSELGFETRFGHPVDLPSRSGGSAAPALRCRSGGADVLSQRVWLRARGDCIRRGNVDNDEQIEDAERCRLDFVLPYALSIKAIVALSARREYTSRGVPGRG